MPAQVEGQLRQICVLHPVEMDTEQARRHAMTATRSVVTAVAALAWKRPGICAVKLRRVHHPHAVLSMAMKSVEMGTLWEQRSTLRTSATTATR